MDDRDLKLSIDEGKRKLIEQLKSFRNTREGFTHNEFSDYVSEVLKAELLKEGTATHGIALQISNEGISNLTDSQIETFVKYGLNEDNYRYECPMCLEELSFDDIFNTIDNGMCSYCKYKLEKE